MGQNSKSPYGKISQVIYTEDRLSFPISWLQKQDYCEYQIYLENIRGIKVRQTQAMVMGYREHKQLYEQFAKEAVPSTVDQMITESKENKLLSREFRVIDTEHGIHGFIDEVWFSPDSFVVIDDKPGARVYLSNIRQVLGYCLAFKYGTVGSDGRQIIGALRERGTSNICWQSPLDKSAEEETVVIVEHIHDLLAGRVPFKSTDNTAKCKACRLNSVCENVK